tara:strand:+ start:155 stop:430 length:276 start_codon:yes stop_codon:yes gene_type:complete
MHINKLLMKKNIEKFILTIFILLNLTVYVQSDENWIQKKKKDEWITKKEKVEWLTKKNKNEWITKKTKKNDLAYVTLLPLALITIYIKRIY